MRKNNFQLFLVLIVLVLISVSANADMPGKKSMSDSKVTFQDLDHYEEWEFHWVTEYVESNGVITGDTSVFIPGSNGRPATAFFWGTNKKTGQATDSISFSNYYAPDYVVMIKGIAADTLNYSRVELSNDNADGNEDNGGLQAVKNKQLIEDARAKAYSKNTKYLLYIGLPVVALIVMVSYFKRRKRKAESK